MVKNRFHVSIKSSATKLMAFKNLNKRENHCFFERYYFFQKVFFIHDNFAQISETRKDVFVIKMESQEKKCFFVQIFILYNNLHAKI